MCSKEYLEVSSKIISIHLLHIALMVAGVIFKEYVGLLGREGFLYLAGHVYLMCRLSR